MPQRLNISPKPLILCLLASVMSGALTAPAQAKDYPKGGVTAEDIKTDLTAIGHKATLAKDAQGDPVISASFAVGSSQIPYKIFFFDCLKGRCKSIQYQVSFEGDATKAASWNKDRRFARAYAEGKTIRLEYDVDVEAGANSLSVQNSAQRFVAVMIAAVKYAG